MHNTKQSLTKRLLSFALAFAMVFGMMPMMAMEAEAAGETIEVLDFTLAHNDDGTYTISNVTVPADKVLVFGVPNQELIDMYGSETNLFEGLKSDFNASIGEAVGAAEISNSLFDVKICQNNTAFSIDSDIAGRMDAGVLIAICEKNVDDDYTIYKMGMTGSVAIGETGSNQLGVADTTVTFDPNNGEATSDVTVADDMTIPTPTWNNFYLEGWYTDVTFADEVTLAEMKELSSNTTVYAKWQVSASDTTPVNKVGDFIVTGGVNGTDYEFADNTLTIKTGTELTISGTTTEDNIEVPSSNTGANIILDGVDIQFTDGNVNEPLSGTVAFDVLGKATITLADGSTNTLQSGSGVNGGLNTLTSASSSETIIKGSVDANAGKLITNGIYVQDITIDGGDINTTVVGLLAEKTITINGGKVNAVGVVGITGKNITINGGMVNATGGESGPAISGTTITIATTMEFATSASALPADSASYTVGNGTTGQYTSTDRYAVVKAGIPTITFDPNNGEAIGSPVEIAADMEIPEPSWDYTFDGWYKDDGTEVTDPTTLTTSTTLYAKWTNNGKIVRTTPIEIDADTATVNNADEGWAWDATSKTLTLDGLTMDIFDDTPDWAIDIGLSGDTFVELEGGSSNSITGKGGITHTGNAIYSGGGSLTTNTEGLGISPRNNLTINGGTYAISSTATNAIGTSGNLTVTDGKVTATTTAARSAILVIGDFYLNGGEVTATAPTGKVAIGSAASVSIETQTTAALTIKAGADSSGTDTTYTGQPYVYAKAQGVAVSATTVEGRVGDDLGDLTAKAVGMGDTVSYQWYSNSTASNTGGTEISGANSATYPLPSDLAEDTYYYYVTATSSEGTFTGAVVTVTVKPALTDAQAVAAAKTAIEGGGTGTGGNYTFTQATANTEAEAKIEIARQINALTGMKETGITVGVDDITISNFDDATDGTDGSFNFTVSLERGSETADTTAKTANITATPVQTTISGKIVDENGADVEGAVVTINGKADTTDANGEYSISGVPNGIYTVTVTTGTGADEKTQTSSVTVTSGTMDDIVFVTEGNKNTTITVDVGEGAPPTTADNLENMFDGTEEDSADVEIELKVAKTDAPTDKDEVDFAIVGQNALGMYLDIELLKTTTPAGGTATEEKIQPPSGQEVTITIQLPAEHRNKAPYQVIHVHNGVTDFIQAIYNEAFHTLTFETSNFSTYAYTYTDASIVIHTLTVNEVGTGGTVNGEYANSNRVNLNAGTKSGYTFVKWTSDNGGIFADENSASTTFTMPADDVTITANWSRNSSGGGGGSTPQTYTPDRNDPEGGDYTVTPSSAQESDEVTIKPEPNAGYMVDAVVVKDNTGEDIEVTNNDDGTYTFVQPDNKVSITVTFKEESESSQTGVKLDKENHSAYMSGVGENQFAPDRSITRAEVVAIFSRLMVEKMDDEMTYTSNFTDITGNEWYANAIGYMEQFDIVSGYEDGTFRPNQPITRAEFATIASRFETFVESDTNNFSDVADDYWAFAYINSVAAQGFVNGYPDGTFKPMQNITRAEAVTVVNKMLERTADEAFIADNMAELTTFVDVDSEHWAYYQILEASNGHEHAMSEDKETWTELQ